MSMRDFPRITKLIDAQHHSRLLATFIYVLYEQPISGYSCIYNKTTSQTGEAQ